MIHHLTSQLLTRQEAEPQGAPPPVTLFARLFPKPTGENGYEEIIQACDLVFGNQVIGAAQNGEATLTQKRNAVADVHAVRAVSLMRRGLQKPIHVSSRSPGDYPPESVPLRSLARLLATEQYVLFADGNTAPAINNLRDCLDLGNVVITHTSGLLGAPLQNIALVTLAHYLNQLSARDCERVLTVVVDNLNAPNPFLAALETERKQTMTLAVDLSGNLDKIIQQQTQMLESEEDEAAKARYAVTLDELQTMKRSPSAVAALAADITQRINAHFDRLTLALQNPALSIPLPDPHEPTLGARLLRDYLSPLPYSITTYTTTRTQIQMLGVHAAIHRYRWEQGSLPPNLSILALKNLAIDPFTGQPFEYKPASLDAGFTASYTLTLASVGTFKLDDRLQPTKQRSPITLPPPPPKIPKLPKGM